MASGNGPATHTALAWPERQLSRLQWKGISATVFSVTCRRNSQDPGTQIDLFAGVSRSCIVFQPWSLTNALEWMASMLNNTMSYAPTSDNARRILILEQYWLFFFQKTSGNLEMLREKHVLSVIQYVPLRNRNRQNSTLLSFLDENATVAFVDWPPAQCWCFGAAW